MPVRFIFLKLDETGKIELHLRERRKFSKNEKKREIAGSPRTGRAQVRQTSERARLSIMFCADFFLYFQRSVDFENFNLFSSFSTIAFILFVRQFFVEPAPFLPSIILAMIDCSSLIYYVNSHFCLPVDPRDYH